MATSEERIKALELKIAKAKAQIKKIKEPEQKINRKQNERRKYLVGAYYMNCTIKMRTPNRKLRLRWMVF